MGIGKNDIINLGVNGLNILNHSRRGSVDIIRERKRRNSLNSVDSFCKYNNSFVEDKDNRNIVIEPIAISDKELIMNFNMTFKTSE